MKKHFIWLALFLPITNLNIANVYAQGANCNQIRSTVLNEEKIGFSAWKKFNTFRNSMPVELEVGHLRTYVSLIKPVHASDQRVFNLILSNASCFESRVIKDSKTQSLETSDNAKALIAMVDKFKSDTSSTKLSNTSNLWKILHEYYSEFWEIISNKKMDETTQSSQNSKKPSPSPSKSGKSSDQKYSLKI